MTISATGDARATSAEDRRFRLYFSGPKSSRNATSRSSSARAQSPVKLEPCMMASVLGFRSASFFKFSSVSGVVGHISRENSRLIFLQRLMRAANDIGRRERFEVAGLLEQVRTKQRFLSFLEEHASVPAVRQVRSLAVAKGVLAGQKGRAIRHGMRFSSSEVVHHHEGANMAADHIGIGRSSQPLIERSALV
jgi:hypothetical protein